MAHIDTVVGQVVYDVFGCSAETAMVWDSTLVPVQCQVGEDESGEPQIMDTMGVLVRVCLLEPEVRPLSYVMTVEGMQHGALHDVLHDLRVSMEFEASTADLGDVQEQAERIVAEFAQGEE